MSETETRDAGRRLTETERETLYAPDRRLYAYYYSFNPTGAPAIDAILSAVAHAGKGYHSTENWSDEGDEDFPGRWGAGRSCIDVIQAAANEAAESTAEVGRLRAVVEAVQALADEWAGYEWPGPMGVQIQRVQAHTWEAATREHAAALRRALAPVSSSGEAEAAERDPADYGRLPNPLRESSPTPEPESTACRTCGHVAIEHTPGRFSIYGVCPVSSSGEASGCETCGGSGFITEADDPDYPEAGAHQTHCPDCRPSSGEAVAAGGKLVHPPQTFTSLATPPVVDWVEDDAMPAAETRGRFESLNPEPTPAPVLSGGQADGEGMRLTDAEWREFQRIPDQGYSHRAWVDAAIARRLAARPVLSREALADLLVQQTVRVQVPNVGTVTGFLRRESADHLADVLAGGEQA